MRQQEREDAINSGFGELNDRVSKIDSRLENVARITKIVDTKLPITWILGSAFAFALLIGGMYFQLKQLSEDMTDLKIAVKAGNGSQASIQGELAILRFRIETIEADRKRGPPIN